VQAFATDVKDQSPWFYYRWLMGNSLAHLKAAEGTPQESEARDVLREVGP
jgi:geranylgeranyl transferase type-2 subunit alpha